MDYYETQKKYRNKRIKAFGSLSLKVFFIIFSVIVGWRIGASDNETLIEENARISKEFEDSKINLEQKLISTKIKLKEANLALEAKNIHEGVNYGFESKRVLSTALAKGISEKKIIDHLRILTNNRVCQTFEPKELSVSTENFIPPNSSITLFGGSLRLKAEGLTVDKNIDRPFYDPKKPLKLTLIYLGGTDIVEKKIPIEKEIVANNFTVKLSVVESTLRGSVIIFYRLCRT